MKVKLVNKIFIAVLLGCSLILSGCFWNKEDQEPRALFSWKSEEVLEGRTQLFETMEELNLNTLYQEFSKDLQAEEIDAFLLEATDENVEVCLLTGSPEWALDEKGEAMVQNVDRVLEINQGLGKGKGIKAILFDVEPYLLKEWDDESDKKIMNNFVKGMKRAYKEANDKGLEVILCIPYFYDDMGFSIELKALIKSGCDRIAIMNYYKDNESKHISREVALADKYGKQVINIYELQAPGKYGLKDENTYYEEGILAIERSFSEIQRIFRGKYVSIAFHEYRALKEVLERE